MRRSISRALAGFFVGLLSLGVSGPASAAGNANNGPRACGSTALATLVQGYVFDGTGCGLGGAPGVEVGYTVSVNNDALVAVQIKGNRYGLPPDKNDFWKGVGTIDPRNPVVKANVYWGNNLDTPAVRIKNLSGQFTAQVSWQAG